MISTCFLLPFLPFLLITFTFTTPLSLSLPPITNLTGPTPLPGFRIEYHGHQTAIDPNAFYALTIQTLAEWASKDFYGEVDELKMYEAAAGYPGVKFTIRLASAEPYERRMAVWGLSSAVQYMASKDRFEAAAIAIFWRGEKQAWLDVTRETANNNDASPQNPNNTLSSPPTSGGNNSTPATILHDDEFNIFINPTGELIPKNAALLALVSAVASAAPHSPTDIIHGLSVRFAPWPAYFLLNEKDGRGHPGPRTTAPFMTWEIVVKVAKAVFQKYQENHVYRELAILTWIGDVPLAAGGIYQAPVPEPEPPEAASE